MPCHAQSRGRALDLLWFGFRLVLQVRRFLDAKLVKEKFDAEPTRVISLQAHQNRGHGIGREVCRDVKDEVVACGDAPQQRFALFVEILLWSCDGVFLRVVLKFADGNHFAKVKLPATCVHVAGSSFKFPYLVFAGAALDLAGAAFVLPFL